MNVKEKVQKEFRDSFMKPEVSKGIWYVYESHLEGGTVVVPSHMFYKEELLQDAEEEDIETQEGWAVRLSAPGFLDCTEWQGVFSTEEEALQSILETFGHD